MTTQQQDENATRARMALIWRAKVDEAMAKAVELNSDWWLAEACRREDIANRFAATTSTTQATTNS